MLDCKAIYDVFCDAGVKFFAGVPDSLLSSFCAYVTDHVPAERHLISPNEGNAVAIAAGFHLATGELPLVYMQNSGHGNAINPLLSLADPDVYSIPMLLMIGWRGEPGTKDEPQHVKQGRVTIPLWRATETSYKILPDSFDEAAKVIRYAAGQAREQSAPYVLLVRKDTFESYKCQSPIANPYPMKREDAVKLLAEHLDSQAIIVSTTGKTSRELFEFRAEKGMQPGQDFLTVGSMGHASQIALGIALAKPQRTIYCFDGDGALIMHMGALASIGSCQVPNFKHVVINNGAHDSVGGQPTAGFEIDIPAIATACGYRYASRVESSSDLQSRLSTFRDANGPALLEIRTNRGARADLGRPTSTPIENKRAFMDFVGP